MAYTVVVCLAGAGLALFAVGRTWVVDVTVRPAPLPTLRTPRTGGELHAWLPALAVVGLAGAGALLATRGPLRRVVGLLQAGCGLAIALGSVEALIGMAEIRGGWPLAATLGGAGLAAGGALVAGRSDRWPAMGARYERRAGQQTAAAGRDTVQVWEAIDRGEDPTVD